MYPETKICTITCAEGLEFTLSSGVEGHAIEINERIIEDPSILLNFVTQFVLKQKNNLFY